MYCPQLAATYMKGEDVSSLYIAQARQLEEQGKFKDAERSGPDVALALPVERETSGQYPLLA